MGFFDFFRKRKKNKEGSERERHYEAVDFKDRSSRDDFVSGNCEVIANASRQMFEAKKEYEVVTSYLSDIQKIDLIQKDRREKIRESAFKIFNLNHERSEMQHTPSKITIAQRAAIESVRDEMENEIKKIADAENYRLIVEGDLHMLESERDAYDYEIQDILGRDEFNRKILTASTVFIIIALVVLVVIQTFVGKNVLFAFAIIVIVMAIAATYFFMAHRKNELELKNNKLKLNRAIYLLNKVKIKYVNNVNMLDYNYEKYHVSDVKELKYNWKEYKRLEEEELRFKKAEQLIDFYNEDLKKQLAENGVLDTGIWIYQLEALIDPAEMVEVRHRLNTRRQKLRKTIETCRDQVNRACVTLKDYINNHPEHEYETRLIMERYKLTNNDLVC